MELKAKKDKNFNFVEKECTFQPMTVSSSKANIRPAKNLDLQVKRIGESNNMIGNKIIASL